MKQGEKSQTLLNTSPLATIIFITMRDLNAELYSNELLSDWTNRINLISAEEYLLNKYLTNKTENVLEAGTGGGRIAFNIEKIGFKNISAFDVVPEMIENAKLIAKKENSNIDFKIADAKSLNEYKSDTYHYLIYLQQVLCFISDADSFSDSLKEAYRILRKEGIVIFSFLDMESRFYNYLFSYFINALRFIRKEKVRKYHLPWIIINKKINKNILNKDQPVTYWVKKDRIISKLQEIGFSILEAKNSNQLHSDTRTRKGMLYIVCKK